jgi:single-stranded-DNA-specific exonuclease
MQWKKSPVSPKEVRNLHERYNVSLLSAAILARRGISGRNDVKFFLENDLSFLHNPFLFDDMETVVDRIQSALDEKEKIRVFGDRDVDGITSTALLVSELSSMGADVSYKLPEGDEPYGMTIAGVDQAMEDGVTLIITVDCGISNFDEIAHASECGIDTLVLDHHLSDDKLPAAMAIIDPKVQGSGYPFEHLAACGVVSKVIWALRFAQTPFYHENCILLHAQPGNGTVLIQAVRLENLMEIDRVREEINPGAGQPNGNQPASGSVWKESGDFPGGYARGNGEGASHDQRQEPVHPFDDQPHQPVHRPWSGRDGDVVQPVRLIRAQTMPVAGQRL